MPPDNAFSRMPPAFTTHFTLTNAPENSGLLQESEKGEMICCSRAEGILKTVPFHSHRVFSYVVATWRGEEPRCKGENREMEREGAGQ